MGWLTSYDDTNKIIDEVSTYTDRLSYTAAAGASEDPAVFVRTVTVSRYRYVGMAYSTAVTCQGALNNPPNVLASLKRENNGDAYSVEVMDLSIGDWAEEE